MIRRREIDSELPPTFMLVVELGEAPIVDLMASTPEAELELRRWLALPETRRQIVDAVADAIAELLEEPS
jgi:hypothetical protein